MTSEDWDMLPDVEDLEKIVDRELKKLEDFEKHQAISELLEIPLKCPHCGEILKKDENIS